MTGYVYAVTNPSIPGLVKIGRTTNMEKRLESLYDTSVPTPFECVCVKEVNNPNDVESNLHTLLSEFRVNDKREFFKVEIEKVKLIFDLISSDLTEVKEEIKKYSVTIPEVGTVSSDHLSTLYTIVERLNLKNITLPSYNGLRKRESDNWTMAQSFNIDVPPNYTEVEEDFIRSEGYIYYPQRPIEHGNKKPLVSQHEKRVYLSQLDFAQEHKIPADYVSDKLKLGVTPDEIILNYKSDKQE
jgi:hypothetical protein